MSMGFSIQRVREKAEETWLGRVMGMKRRRNHGNGVGPHRGRVADHDPENADGWRMYDVREEDEADKSDGSEVDGRGEVELKDAGDDVGNGAATKGRLRFRAGIAEIPEGLSEGARRRVRGKRTSRKELELESNAWEARWTASDGDEEDGMWNGTASPSEDKGTGSMAEREVEHEGKGETDEEDNDEEEFGEVLRKLEDERRADMMIAKELARLKGNLEPIFSLRIRMQTIMKLANRLPSQKKPHEDEETEGVRKKSFRSVVRLLEACMALEINLSTNQREKDLDPGEAREMADFSSELENLWHVIRQSHNDYSHEREQVLEDLSKHMSDISKMSIDAEKKFKAVQQSINLQISAISKDMERLLKRTQVMRNPIEFVEPPSGENQMDHNPEIFDDSDFFQQILKEIVESESLEDRASSRALLAQRSKSKLRKQVDRRASKGRKIRYVTHEKLQGFLAPREIMYPSGIDELVAGLFGRRSLIAVEDGET
uniref:Protein BFR2 n=1 Tax=Compsopogon caeruleus TaxID=31354 RepID=A0A6T6CQ15_9RHOD|mmetsp:Transcript_9014/g.18191  ORF Transcript_9014/g.18191 Transcript_9014/m.18191 type:complete len:488 (+) Transcript_9014:237-1700(+)